MSPRAIEWALRIAAGVAWIALLIVSILGLTAWAVATSAVASTFTLSAVFFATLPGMLEAWHHAIEYGARNADLIRPQDKRTGLRVVGR